MPYYKDKLNNVHYLDDAQFDYLLPHGSELISPKEADELMAANIPDENEEIHPDPVEKLKTFLESNPDVKSLVL